MTEWESLTRSLKSISPQEVDAIDGLARAIVAGLVSDAEIERAIHEGRTLELYERLAKANLESERRPMTSPQDVRFVADVQFWMGDSASGQEVDISQLAREWLQMRSALERIERADASEFIRWSDEQQAAGNRLNEWDWFAKLAREGLSGADNYDV